MKITLINAGKTQERYLRDGIAIFEKRLAHYISFGNIFINGSGKMKYQSELKQKEAEGKAILQALERSDRSVLLDVTGKQMDSEEFASYIQQSMNRGIRNMSFVIGGPYGFSDEVYRSVPEQISLSAMTFSHQMIRLIFLEQLYRAFTILRGEPYHHA